MKSVRHESLGAPTLLYRHQTTTTITSKNNDNPQLPITRQRFRPATLTPQQLYMNDFLEMDPFKNWFLEKKKRKGSGLKKRVVESGGAENNSTKKMKVEDGVDENLEDDNDKKKKKEEKIAASDDIEEKRAALKYYTFDLDKNDVPEKYIVEEKHTKDDNDSEKRQLKEEFDEKIVGEVVVDGDDEILSEETTRKNEVGGPLGYGNCLVAISCTCSRCCAAVSPPAAATPTAAHNSSGDDSEWNPDSDDSENDQDATTTNPTTFLVHPVGQQLSSITIDKLHMPRDEIIEASDCTPPKRNTVDVGGTILQIEVCGMGVPNQVKRMNQEEGCQSECLVVRTSRYCHVILASGRSNDSSSDNGDGESDNGSLSSAKLGRRRCSTTFELMKLSRVNLCTSSPPSYLPVSVACDPKVIFSPFANPSFTILSRLNEDQKISGLNCTTIHNVVQHGEESMVTKHTISSLANISLIVYHASEMSVLWAAARGRNVPARKKSKNVTHNTIGGELLGGYGHSLFKINLRDDSTSHVWSPSKAEYTSEGVHSINGIMNDFHHKHVVWVSSSSACKVWALDVRPNAANVLMCFSLAQLSDDFGPELGVTGIYGAGMIMTQPMPMNDCRNDGSSYTSDRELREYAPPTMFGLKKDPNTYSLHTYQLPTTQPRFQTMPLEGSSFVDVPKVKYSTSCIARSSIYPLPICSDKTFRVGLTTLRCKANTALRKVDWKDKLGYDAAPDIIYALTMTSVGDIYCHSLLECDSTREVQAQCMEGMPVGAAAISVPVLGKSDNKATEGAFRISLSNDFPPPFDDLALYDLALSRAPRLRDCLNSDDTKRRRNTALTPQSSSSITQVNFDFSDVPEQLPILRRNGKDGSSKYQGVSFDKTKTKWKAQIVIDGKRHRIGCYDDEEEAAKDYACAVFKYRGEQKQMIDLSDVPEQLPILKSNGKTGNSKYQGVSFDKTSGKWLAQICNDGKRYHIGRYDTEEEAAKDYARAVFKFQGGTLNVSRSSNSSI